MPTFLLVMNFKPRLHRPLEHWLLGIARGLQSSGGRLHVILSAEPVEWWAEEFARVGDFTVVPEIRNAWRPRPVLAVLRRVKPRAIGFIFVPMGDPRTWLLARWPGIRRRIYLDHNSWEVSAKGGLKRILARVRGLLTSAAFDEFISISEYNRRRNVERLHIAARKNRVILNGVLPPPVPAAGGGDSPSGQRYVFYVGQLMRDKGVHTLLKAWAGLRGTPAVAGTQLWLAGAGKEEAAMHELAQELHLLDGPTPSAQFLGLRNDVPALMRGALANVIPSEWAEGFGLTAAEALAAGRPVIVSDAGALPEVVGNCGAIFSRGSADDLATKLVEVLQQPDFDGAPLVTRYEQNFRLDQMITAYVDRFQDALK